MNVIVFASRKGGSGKSTLAAHLAAHVHKVTKPCLLVDADPQGSLTLWHKLVPRNLCQSVNDPCGSASTSRHGFVTLWTCAARWAARVLFPEPPLRDAKTITFIPSPPVDPRWRK